MNTSNNRRRREPEVFAPDSRPGASDLVYCKGCGEALQDRVNVPRRAVVITMMCDACREKHGHDLMPAPGAPTFCYRCGRPDELFVMEGISPVTYHVCPHCVPERAARYRTGDFEVPPPPDPEGAKA